MDLYSEMIQAVQDDLTIGSESSLYPLPLVKRAINRAYRKSGALFRWPSLEDAQKTSTEAATEFYDYPQNWRPDSIWKLSVDGKDYGDPLVFKDYLYEKENSLPAGLDKMWGNQWTRYFIYPTPTTDGEYNIEIHGMMNVEKLVNDRDFTIFSYSLPEGNEAIVLEAVAILKAKGEEEKSADFRSSEAKGILSIAWQKIRQEQSRNEKTQPLFDIPDFFSRGGTRTRTGRFD